MNYIDEESLDIFRNLNATDTLCDYAISNEATFNDLWEEIERYYRTISFACKNYFGDTYNNSKAEEYLNEAYKLYRELLECCKIHNISSTDKLKATGNLLVREPKVYNNIPLRRHLLLTLLTIGCYLTDVALYLKVLIVNESGARVIVIAGASHIRRLQALLISGGFCGESLSILVDLSILVQYKTLLKSNMYLAVQTIVAFVSVNYLLSAAIIKA